MHEGGGTPSGKASRILKQKHIGDLGVGTIPKKSARKNRKVLKENKKEDAESPLTFIICLERSL